MEEPIYPVVKLVQTWSCKQKAGRLLASLCPGEERQIFEA